MGTLLHRFYEAVALVLHTCMPVCKDLILAWAASIGMAMMLDERYVPPASCLVKSCQLGATSPRVVQAELPLRRFEVAA